MKRYNQTEKRAFELKFGPPVQKQKFTVWGCYLGNLLIAEGNYGYCVWYRDTYNDKLKIKGVK